MKKQDILVYWLDGTNTRFPAVRMKSSEISNRDSEMATLTFKFGKNGHGALINLDNVKFFEITKTCTED